MDEHKAFSISLPTAIVTVVLLDTRCSRSEMASPSLPNRTIPTMLGQAIRHLKIEFRRSRENLRRVRDLEMLVALGCTIQLSAI